MTTYRRHQAVRPFPWTILQARGCPALLRHSKHHQSNTSRSNPTSKQPIPHSQSNSTSSTNSTNSTCSTSHSTLTTSSSRSSHNNSNINHNLGLKEPSRHPAITLSSNSNTPSNTFYLNNNR